MRIINLLFFITSYTFFSQEKVICDFDTKLPLSYASIQILGTENGFYSDNYGKFDILKLKKNDSTLLISHINYKSKALKTSEIRDTIFLKPSEITLKEITLITGKSKENTIGYIKSKKTLSWHIRPKTELATLIKYNTKYKDVYINKIYLPIGKESIKQIKNEWKSIFPKFNSTFRVNIYSNINNKPGDKLLNYSIINCSEKSKDIIMIDVSNEYIKYPNEGIFIGVEMIGELNDESKIMINNFSILPSFQFTKKIKKSILSSSYIKSIFSGNNWINIIDSEEFIPVIKYNMAISLELSIYED